MSLPGTHPPTALWQAECLADDIDIPDEAVAWVRDEAVEFFESGGSKLPRHAGIAGAEVHAWHDLQQRQFESTDTGTMLEALERAFDKLGTGAAAPGPAAADAVGTVCEAPARDAELLFERLGVAARWKSVEADLVSMGEVPSVAALRRRAPPLQGLAPRRSCCPPASRAAALRREPLARPRPELGDAILGGARGSTDRRTPRAQVG